MKQDLTTHVHTCKGEIKTFLSSVRPTTGIWAEWIGDLNGLGIIMHLEEGKAVRVPGSDFVTVAEAKVFLAEYADECTTGRPTPEPANLEWVDLLEYLPPDTEFVLLRGLSGMRGRSFVTLGRRDTKYRPSLNGYTRWLGVSNNDLADDGFVPTHWTRIAVPEQPKFEHVHMRRPNYFEGTVGSYITAAAEEVIQYSQLKRAPCTLVFNAVELTITRVSTPATVYSDFHRLLGVEP